MGISLQRRNRKLYDSDSLNFVAGIRRGIKRISGGEAMVNALNIILWIVASCLSAEFLGYGLHRLLHSGAIGFLNRSHMRHHRVHYGPLQKQRFTEYHDATDETVSLGNIGLEWLVPAGVFIVLAEGVFWFLRIRLLFQLIYFSATLSWSFLMFSYLDDVMHIEGFWLERNLWLQQWFVSARR
jgi:hypothetical protein